MNNENERVLPFGSAFRIVKLCAVRIGIEVKNEQTRFQESFISTLGV